jgi:hypothetical protein
MEQKQYLRRIHAMRLFKTAAMLMALSLSAGAASLPLPDQEPIPVSEEVSEIVLNLNGVADIEFVESDGFLGVQDLICSAVCSAKTLRVERSGPRLIFTQDSNRLSWTRWESLEAASYRLLLPKGRKVVVNGGNAALSGSIQARSLSMHVSNLSTHDLNVSVDDDLEISGALAHLDMRVKRARRVFLRLGVLTGRLSAPTGTELKDSSRRSTLRVRPNKD